MPAEKKEELALSPNEPNLASKLKEDIDHPNRLILTKEGVKKLFLIDDAGLENFLNNAIPHYRVGEELRFNRHQVVEWFVHQATLQASSYGA